MIPNDQIDDIRRSLAARAEEVCAHLLRGGKRRGNKWICGGVDGGAGSSMDVVLEGEKAGVWLDRATSEGGDMIQLWVLNQGLKFPEAVKAAADFLNVTTDEDAPPSAARAQTLNPRDFVIQEPPPPEAERQPVPFAQDATPPWAAPAPLVDWQACVERMTDAKCSELATWRGYSAEMVEWMVANDLVGVYNGSFAFPVHDKAGRVVRIHYRLPKKGWAYYPTGGETAPFIIGNPQHATYTLAFESQWDAIAILDRLQAHDPENIGRYAAIITRGATSNNDFSKVECRELIACPQNDPPEKASPKTGRTPAQEWLYQINETRNKSIPFAVFETPAKHADANDWIRADKPDHYAVFHAAIEGACDPLLKNIRSGHQILEMKIKDDPNALIGYERRFLTRGSSYLIIGPSGIGKSTLTIGFGAHACAGVEWNGITFRRPMKTLVVQAENDEGDLHEMLDGSLKASELNGEQRELALRNINFVQETSRTGHDFCQWLENMIIRTGAELVILDPLLSYVGDDISQQKVASHFLRNGIQPILQRTGVVLIVVHHTGKPPSDAKSRSHWSPSDFAYLGLGSSELTNWARAVSVLMPKGSSGVYRFLTAKRGGRIGLINRYTGERTSQVFLRHSEHGLGWVQCEEPTEAEASTGKGGRKQAITVEQVIAEFSKSDQPIRKDHLISELAAKHQTSERTVRERLDSCLHLNLLHVHENQPRPGGGKPVVLLRKGDNPNGKNQMETS